MVHKLAGCRRNAKVSCEHDALADRNQRRYYVPFFVAWIYRSIGIQREIMVSAAMTHLHLRQALPLSRAWFCGVGEDIA